MSTASEHDKNVLKTVLKISGLMFSYATTGNDVNSWALHDLSLTVTEGEIVCILGASGCGKSTLLNVIAGLLPPGAGTIEFSNQSDAAGRIGYIFQNDALFPWRTVGENLLLASEITRTIPKADAGEKIKQHLQTFHLQEKVLRQYPSQLSGGMRQRVSIVQALMFNPELFLLDEPFSALDFYTKLKLEGEFVALVKEQRKAAVLVTHDIEEAVAMADRVLIMSKDGALIAEFQIQPEEGARSPDAARGTAKFAQYYQSIWAELKMVIGQ